MQRPAPDAEVIDSWKGISGYFHHDIRTVQRWERTRGLPVRRLPGGARPGVYAIRSELEAWRRGPGTGPAWAEDAAAAAPPSLAVLPFLNLARDEDQYFADGLADEIITALSLLPGFRVIARTSSFAFRDRQQDIREIGRKLNARAILEGSIRRSGSRLRVTAQLIDAGEGCHLWSRRFDRELTDVLAIQDEIAGAIADALRVRLTNGVRPARVHTHNQDAYHLWLKGRYHILRQTPNEILRSRELFAEAIALDAGFARAHLGLAESWWEGAVLGLDRPREAVAVGRPSVSRALEIDGALGEAHAMLGVFRGIHDFDWEAAERSFRRGLELCPASPQIRTRYAAWLLEPNLRFEEARAELEAALEIDPLSPVIHASLGHELIFQRDFAHAEKVLRFAVGLDPGFWIAHLMLAGACAFQGRFGECLAICEGALQAIGPNPVFLGGVALVSGILGDRQRVETIRRQLTEPGRYVCNLAVAWSHLGCGDPGACLAWLEKAVEEREPLIVELNPKPLYDAIRSHPRFQSLLASMRLVKSAS